MQYDQCMGCVCLAVVVLVLVRVRRTRALWCRQDDSLRRPRAQSHRR